MKNFLRALKFSWIYRRRLFLSMVCALMAAAFWGLNFLSITPILTILSGKQNLQEWIDAKIDASQREIDSLTQGPEGLNAAKAELQRVETCAEGRTRDQRKEQLSGVIAGLESKLDSATTRQWRYRQVKDSVIRFLPRDRFQTLACLLLFVVICVAVKGVFEFFQEYLVGSV